MILVNGDSFTYGDELDGSRNKQGRDFDTHHHHTWAYKLSSMTGHKYVNLAENGSSNHKIYRRTMEYLMGLNDTHVQDKVDMLIIVWTSFARYEICETYFTPEDKHAYIHQEHNMNQIIPFHKPTSFLFKGDPVDVKIDKKRFDALKNYVEYVLTMQTQIIEMFMQMNHIQWICDKLNIPVMQGVIHSDMYKNYLSTMKLKGWDGYKTLSTKYFNALRPECKMGLGHYSDLYHLSKEKYTLKPLGHADEDAHTEYAEILYGIIKEKDWLNVTN